MPLQQGRSRQAISANIATERRAGKPANQAAAIAYAIARRSHAQGGVVTGGPRMAETMLESSKDGGMRRMAQGGHITAAQRRALPASQFALGKGHYPIDTAGRARAALSRGAANATPAQQARIRAAVKRKYPSMQVRGAGLLDDVVKR